MLRNESALGLCHVLTGAAVVMVIEAGRVQSLLVSSLVSSRGIRSGRDRLRRFLLALLAILAAITICEPAFAQGPPLNLSATSVPGGVELLFNFAYQSAGLSIVRTPAWGSGQQLRPFGLFFQDGNLPPDPGGGIDPYVTPGRQYTYKVVYPNNPVTNGSVTINYAAACSFVGHCPAGAGQPPQYTINCKQPADFYTSTTQGPSGSRTMSFSGIGNVFPSSNEITYACVPQLPGITIGGISPSSGLCSGFSQTVNVASCHVPPPPPPKPINSCQQCTANGQKCVKSGSGFICTGNAR
jgi:hypothetical protein